MRNRQWENVRHGGRERWNYVEWRDYSPAPSTHSRYRHVIGYIVKTKNKRKCKDWLVQCAEVRHVDLYPITLAKLTNLSAAEARNVATIIFEGMNNEV